MRASIFISIVLLAVGFIGSLANIFLGFGLSKNSSADSDQHLVIALGSLFFVVIGGIAAIRFSKIYLQSFEQDVLSPESTPEHSRLTPLQKLKRLQEQRQNALNLVLVAFVILVLSLISGTISQSGRFPIVHGILGIGLALTLFNSIIRWISLLRP